MKAIRAFGKVPQLVRGKSDAQVQERKLAYRLRKARREGLVSAEDEAELARLDSDAQQLPEDPSDAAQLAGEQRIRELMEAIRAFAKVPQRVRGTSDAQVEERNLAYRLRNARRDGLLSAEDETELARLDAMETTGR